MRPDRLYQFHAPSVVKLILAHIQSPDLGQLISIDDIEQRTDSLRHQSVRYMSVSTSANTVNAQFA